MGRIRKVIVSKECQKKRDTTNGSNIDWHSGVMTSHGFFADFPGAGPPIDACEKPGFPRCVRADSLASAARPGLSPGRVPANVQRRDEHGGPAAGDRPEGAVQGHGRVWPVLLVVRLWPQRQPAVVRR